MISKQELKKHLTHTRPGVTSDQDWGQLTVIKEYEHLPIEGKRVMDVGGNIGAMAIRCALEGCEYVVTYEPEPSNFSMLSYNTYPFAEVVKPVKAAVTNRPTGMKTELWLTNERTMGSCSVIHFRGRTGIEVDTVNFMEEIQKHQFQSIKLDCEGSEWELLLLNSLPPCVTDVVAELHFTKRIWRTEFFPELKEHMNDQGFALIRLPKDTGKNFHTIAHWRR